MLELHSCRKRYTLDLDKVCSPEETVNRVKKLLEEKGAGILESTKRIDSGRLSIPVYMSLCGPQSLKVLPGRKQMGKGASPAQAEASALMELMERYSLFYFWENISQDFCATWSLAEELHSEDLIPMEQILYAVEDKLTEDQARQILDLLDWRFCPALDVQEQKVVYAPLDLFKKLNEFNGSSAGNSFEEAVLQGACELVERHVCALIDREQPQLPTLDPASFKDPVLLELSSCFTQKGIRIWLKDFSLETKVPTVGALAYDPATFPGLSEIVFTAGTATSPAKAAIRALTEVAQLAGDFEAGSNYEASGLSKFSSLQECSWLKEGQLIALDSLPDISHEDIQQEIMNLSTALNELNYKLYTIDVSHPDLQIPVTYNFIPGFQFRERSRHSSLGLFVGRILAEQYPVDWARKGLQSIAEIYPQAHFLPFFQGLLQIREANPNQAAKLFIQAQDIQPSAEEEALVAFYLAYALSLQDKWPEAIPALDKALELSPFVHAYYNLRGVALFKSQDYTGAARDFQSALQLDSGSAMDYANLGLCHKHLGQKKAAAEYLQTALNLDPTLEFAFKNLQDLNSSK